MARMITFVCSECGQTYSWVLEGDIEDICAYCCGRYPNGVQCKGGNKEKVEKVAKKREQNEIQNS